MRFYASTMAWRNSSSVGIRLVGHGYHMGKGVVKLLQLFGGSRC